VAGERARVLAATAFGLLALGAAFVVSTAAHDATEPYRQALVGPLRDAAASRGGPAWALWNAVAIWAAEVVLAPDFYLALGVILLLERLRPVHRDQPSLTPSAAHDFGWFLLQSGVFLPLNGLILVQLDLLYAAYLASWSVSVPAEASAPFRFVLAVLWSDFLEWSSHVVRHKVPWFWHFHSVHHAQRSLNAFSDTRYHPVEYQIAQLVRYLPFVLLRVPIPVVIGWGLVARWYARTYHANVRLNLGLLRWVLVTPQSHRVHHSARPEHRDQNFGVILSVWDHLFGTACRDVDVYPETGVQDPGFPHERGYADVLSLRPVAAQLVYPFALICRSVSGRQRA